MPILVVVFLLGIAATLFAQYLIRYIFMFLIRRRYYKLVLAMHKEYEDHKKEVVDDAIQQLEDYANEE